MPAFAHLGGMTTDLNKEKVYVSFLHSHKALDLGFEFKY
jgi:hypothetical protein